MNQDFVRQQSIPLEVKLKSLIQSYRFNCIGTVTEVSSSGDRINVVLPYLDSNLRPRIIKGIEVVRLGSHALEIKYKPVVGDVAFVFAFSDYVSSCIYNDSAKKKSVHFDPYSNVTMKALIVHASDDKAKTTITIDDSEVTLDTDLELKVNCNKVTINNHLTVDG